MLEKKTMIVKLETAFFCRYGRLWQHRRMNDINPSASEHDYYMALSATAIFYIVEHCFHNNGQEYIDGFNNDNTVVGNSDCGRLHDVVNELLRGFYDLMSNDIDENRIAAAWLNHQNHWGQGKTLVECYADGYGIDYDLVNEISQDGIGTYFGF